MSERVAFNWQDPFLLEDQLTDDERMIRDAAAAFGKSELLPRISEAYLSETTEPELFRLMGRQGLLGVTLPEEYGAANASYVAYG
ncbi:acyl-CoA dehydrogenase family protein, partial [Mesorhizobium sp. M1D.F.Ca.ET.231.01.1.1]